MQIKTLSSPQRIALVISDDGSGFTPGAQAGVAQGHFGIQGMRERLERLDGSLRIDSAPGHGTTIFAEAPLRTYDGEVAERPIDTNHPTRQPSALEPHVRL